MYKIFKNILNGEYELVDILNKIDEYYVKSKLTKEQKEELEEEAREKANPVNSYAPLEERLEALESRVDRLETKLSSQGQTSPEEPSEEEYPEYVQPTGAHDAYHVGDKITYNGKKYECVYDGCVWTPDTYPQGWKEVEESE